MIKHLRNGLAPMLLAASVLAFGACASAENDPPALGEEAEMSDTVVEASLEDHDITLRPSEVEAGTVMFQVFNNGDVNHDFEIRSANGNRVNEELKFTLNPHNSAEIEVDLTPGVYTILCTVGDHQDTGERTQLRVL